LIERARLSGFDHQLLKMARKINNSMPAYTIDRLTNALNDIKKSIKGTKVGVLGLSYKADVSDIRESPALEVIDLLREEGAQLEIYDKYFIEKSTVKSISELLSKVDAIVIAVDHKEFKTSLYPLLKKYKIKVIIDGKNCLDKDKIIKMGIIYRGIGR